MADFKWAELAAEALATLLGATAAFLLEAARRWLEQRAVRAEAIRAALFALVQQRTFLRLTEEKALKTFRSHLFDPLCLCPLTYHRRTPM